MQRGRGRGLSVFFFFFSFSLFISFFAKNVILVTAGFLCWVSELEKAEVTSDQDGEEEREGSQGVRKRENKKSEELMLAKEA